MPWRETPAELARARAERPVVVPHADGRLFGILTPPAESASNGRCVVLFTRPRSHRNRMWVEGARRLAARGFTCFRFDYHGTGDSEGTSGRLDPNHPHQGDALAVLRHLRDQEGQRRFVLLGSCFDARTALSTFGEEHAAIEALVFISAPVMALDDAIKVDADRKDWSHLVRALRNGENWRALASAERWKYMATVVGRVARRSVGARDTNGAPGLSPDFVRNFEALAASRARALFVYGLEDPEYLTFQVAERELWPRLSAEARARMAIEVWPGVVHSGFLEMGRQREIYERAVSWIEALEPGDGGGLTRAVASNTAGAA